MRAYLDRSKLYANILLEVDYNPQVKQWVNKYRIFQHIVTGTSFKLSVFIYLFIYLFGVLRRYQHCTGHIMTGSWKGRGNQYIEFARVVYCKLPTNSKQLPAFPLETMTGIEPRPQRREARVLPLCHRGPLNSVYVFPLQCAMKITLQHLMDSILTS